MPAVRVVGVRAQVQAELVKRFRERRGWTQAQAAAWYGCSEREWRRWERLEVAVSSPALKRMAASRVAIPHGKP